MTRKELPAQAANLKRSVGSAAICTPATIESLKLYLLVSSPVFSREKNAAANLKGSRPKRLPDRITALNKTENRGAKVTVLGIPQNDHNKPSLQERWTLATEAVNITLRSLTDAIKNQPQKSTTKIVPTTSGLHYLQPTCSLPLRPISANCVSAISEEACRSQSSQPTASANNTQGLRAQAECACVAFAALRSMQLKRGPYKEIPRLQLENGMSALISKLIALGYDDLAIKELRILRRRLDAASDCLPPKEGIDSPGLIKDLGNNTAMKFKETLATLLCFESQTTDKPTLALIIASQLQALKLISSKGNASTVESALEYLQPSSSYSPTVFIERLMTGDLEFRSKAMDQFDSFMSSLIALCHKTTDSADGLRLESSRKMCSSIVFAIQKTVLEIRLWWWRISDNNGNISKEIVEPLIQYLNSFRRRSTSNQIKVYEMAKNATVMLVDRVTRSMENLTVISKSLGGSLSSVYQILSEIAQESHLYDEAVQWLKNATDFSRRSGASPSRICSLLCQSTNIRIRDFFARSRHDQLLDSMKETSKGLQGDLRGEAAEIDDLLLNVVTLRKLTFSILYKNSTQKHESTSFLSILDECSDLIIFGIKFLARYLGRGPSPGDDEKNLSRHKHRMILVWNNTSPFFESLAAMTRFSMPTGMKNWEILYSGLQDCIGLISILNDLKASRKLDMESQELKELNVLPLSNAFWYRYLYLKAKSEHLQESRRCLRLSIELLKPLKISEKIIGLLPTKLENLGLLYEASKDYTAAVKVYTDALALHIEGGILNDVAKSAASQPLKEIFDKSEFNSFGRLLSSYLRAVLKTDRQDPEKTIFFGNKSLNPDERGILLEQQLNAIASMLPVQGHPQGIFSTLKALVTSVLHVYDPSKFPIRRLRASVRILQVHLTHPGSIGMDLLNQILRKKEKSLESNANSFDMNLGHFESHLLESQEALEALLGENLNIQDVERNLRLWYQMVKECQDYSSLQKRVNDIASWILELEFLAEYLEMQGFHLLRLTALHILFTVEEMKPSIDNSTIILTASMLGSQFMRLGYLMEAHQALNKARGYLDGSKVSPDAAIRWNIVSAELSLASSNILKCEEHLSTARDIFEADVNQEKIRNSTFKERNRMIRSVSDASYAYSLLAVANGQVSEAHFFAKQYVKLNYRAWAMLEHHVCKSNPLDNTRNSEDESNALVDQMSHISLEEHPSSISPISQTVLQSAPFWSLVPRLFCGLMHISQLFVHDGLFLEAHYYIEQAQKIAIRTNSAGLKSQSLGLLGDVLTRNGELNEGLATLQQALSVRSELSDDHFMALLQLFIANNFSLQSQTEPADSAFAYAERLLEHLIITSPMEKSICQLDAAPSTEIQMDVKLIKEKAFPPRNTRASKKLSSKTLVGKTTKVTRAMSPKRQTSENIRVSLLWQTKGRALRQRATVAMRDNCINAATSYLQQAAKASSLPYDQMQNICLSGSLYLRQALDRMAADPVFCILLESTISQPSIFNKNSHQDASNLKSNLMTGGDFSPSKKITVKESLRKANQIVTPSPLEFLNLLQRTKESILNVHNQAKTMCSVSNIHNITDVLIRTLTMLSAINFSQPDGSPSPYFALYIMELGRTISTTRSYLSLCVERQLSNHSDPFKWPVVPNGSLHESTALLTANNSSDFTTFQSQYIDIIPPSWTVLSLSLSESHDEIRIARVRSGQSPFILALPLNRHNARDSEEDAFGFDIGKDELLEIIHLTNYSTHNNHDLAKKGAKSEWWKVRAALDVRLKGLLCNMENLWLGGFRGIFSQARHDPELLSRFQHSLQNILDKHLPSRQKNDRNKKSDRIVLDRQVLELFVGLGVPAGQENFDESLTDLLYFVIDILQFHGERNAYDEIDFDSIAVEVIDTLHQYYEAAKNTSSDDNKQHTILILDKELHCFPWESLPCMDGCAVSRLPSLGWLRDRILQQSISQQQDSRGLLANHGLCVSRDHGAAILNPAGDLTATQTKFEQPLERLTGWDTMINRAPSQDEMKAFLETREIFLYLGHGSGAQYIRPRTVKKLNKCAVALLMGCSSGALKQGGEFEPYGTPMNYMLAGCPALLANLWDITDKDIDKFSYDVLEKWGLWTTPTAADFSHHPTQSVPVSASSPSKKKTKKRGRIPVGTPAPEPSSNSSTLLSLDQAVAQSRDSCKLRYLNGAAPVVYGVPVFLS